MIQFWACLTALVGSARANPRLEPLDRLVDRELRLAGADVFFGAADRSARVRWCTSRRMLADPPPDLAPAPDWDAIAAREWHAEASAGCGFETPWRTAYAATAAARLGVGGLVPDYQGGDAEPGAAALRGGVGGRAYSGPFSAVAELEGRIDLGGAAAAGLALPEAWAGLDNGSLNVGFGLRDRWQGPGRFGSLLLTDNARPAPLASVGWESPDVRILGRVHLEGGAGWLDGERSDVSHPGWLWMDFRWLPLPLLELGAGRSGLFGGEGRPRPGLFELLVPLEPHVYDDPDQIEADQDEIAALDARLTLPLGRWSGQSTSVANGRRRADGIDVVELYWQYGGEDVIARRNLGVPAPALAGVANLYGAEALAGPLGVNVELARILDDYFRWYTGHRVYHEGFTRESRSMGHAAGGDAIRRSVAASWQQAEWGVELWGERQTRVGVVEATGDAVLALAVDEERLRAGVDGWWLAGQTGWWQVGVAGERIEGADFVLGADGWGVHLSVGR